MSERRGEIVREIWFLWGQKVATVAESGKWGLGAGGWVSLLHTSQSCPAEMATLRSQVGRGPAPGHSEG